MVELIKYDLLLGGSELFRSGDIQGINDDDADKPIESIERSLIPFTKSEYEKQSEIAKLLNKKKNLHQPHCIARALQLLDSVSINEEVTKKDAIIQICKPLLQKPNSTANRAGTNSAVTGPGVTSPVATSLADYYPTRALGQLFGNVNPVNYEESLKVLTAFVKTSKTSDPSRDPLNPENIRDPSESKSLSLAIERLSRAFNNVLEKDKAPPKKFSEIKLPIPTFCGKDPSGNVTRDTRIKMPKAGNPVFVQLKNTSKELLAYHLKHIQKISEFMKTIFNISRDGDSWKVEGPNIQLMFEGFDALNIITKQARELLIEYYSGCEEIYQKGVKIYENAEATKVANAAKATQATKGQGQGQEQGQEQGQGNIRG
jgi:hypothetical protein